MFLEKTMKNNYFLLSFDVEEFTLPFEIKCSKSYSEEELFSIGAQGLEKILFLLEKEKIVATFFCTYSFFLRYPQLLKKAVALGCEIGIHGYQHDDDYKKMAENEVVLIFSKAKSVMEKVLKTKIFGFRGPRFHAPSLQVLKRAGFKYDSSLHPTYVPGRYNNILKPLNFFFRDGLWEVPVSVCPYVRFPFSWVWFRNLPFLYAKICSLICSLKTRYVLLYFHPWEAVSGIQEGYPLLMRNTGYVFEEKLKKYIRWAKKKGRFITILSFLKGRMHSAA